MIEIDIKKRVRRPRGAVVRLRPISHSLTAESNYRKGLYAILSAIRGEVKNSVLPAYTAYNGSIRDNSAWFDSLKNLIAYELARNTNLFQSAADEEEKRNRKKFIASVKKELSIDLQQILVADDMAQLLRDYNALNNALIKSLTDDIVKDVERLVYDAKITRESAKSLSDKLTKRFKVAKSRADLIAVDQLNKLNADFNERRNLQVGIKKYEWLTSRNERVRSLHRSLDGNIYKYGESTGAEEGLPPGKPIRCQCIAVPVVEF